MLQIFASPMNTNMEYWLLLMLMIGLTYLGQTKSNALYHRVVRQAANGNG
jgi:hypothetical protein